MLLPQLSRLQQKNGLQKDDEPEHSGSVLQHALVTDRLRSLRKRKLQLEKELTGLHGQSASDGANRRNLLRDVVKDEPSLKRKSKEIRKPSKREGKKVKVVSFYEDTDFGTASAGFVETERDELVRKGILTPFHKLEGFERRLQQPGPSNSHNLLERKDENGKTEDSGSIDRATQSMLLAAEARPTTKLLDAKDLPKLEAPSVPFRRLRKFYKTHDSLDNVQKSKKKRPLPETKWTKRISHEDSSVQESEAGQRILTTSSCEEEELDDADDNETSCVQLEGGLNIPESIFSKLFEYQRVGVHWLWELHCQSAGGIIGDETVQVLSFLGSLHFSKMYKPSIVICPVSCHTLASMEKRSTEMVPGFSRDLIMPYLLCRMKADVNAHLTKKTEHVLFCSLTVEQRSTYRAFPCELRGRTDFGWELEFSVRD